MPYASDRMRQRRQELGIKLQDFAPRVGVSYGHYRNAEYRNKPMAIEVFHRVARELAVPVNELLAEENRVDTPTPRDATAGGSSTETAEAEAAQAEAEAAETAEARGVA